MSEMQVCPSCKKRVTVGDAERVPCPKCKKTVWFFSYEEVPPVSMPNTPVKMPEIVRRLAGVIVGLALLLVFFGAIKSVFLVICVAIAGGAVALAVFEHKSASAAREELSIARYTESNNATLRDRFDECRRRYGHLLMTMKANIARQRELIDAEANMKIQQARDAGEQVKRDAGLRIDEWSKAVEQARAASAHAQVTVNRMKQRCEEVGKRYVKDHLSWARKGVNANPDTFLRKKHAVENAASFARACELPFPQNVETEALRELEAVFRQKVEQQRLKEELRNLKREQAEQKKFEAELLKTQQEELRIQAEVERRRLELERASREDMAHVAAMTADLERMQQELIDARRLTERAESNAQRTKVGWVYVLSNLGSFGERVFKVGLTRRYDPEERVKELSGASVPFPFDVHATIHAKDAPALENELHRTLSRFRVNRANPRKEFFRCSLTDIQEAVKGAHGGRVDYIMEPEASEYYESQRITDEQMAADNAALESAGFRFDADD